MRKKTLPLLVAIVASAIFAINCADRDGVTLPTADLEDGAEQFEVWIADQSDTRTVNGLRFGGTLHIFAGSDLMGRSAASAVPTDRIDLSEATASLCLQATGRNPVRPHMIRFNRGDTHAVLSFVASGHIVIFDAASRTPLACFLTTQSPTGQQAHAGFVAPDGSYILVANQNGKRLERINTDFATNTFVHDQAATLDLATCTTPNGQPCQDPATRPDNAPICPIIDESSALGFVTLRGGGLLVVDARRENDQIRIVAEYDNATVKGNGCGGVQAGGQMFINSGGSPAAVPVGHPHKFGFDVYRFPLSGYAASNAPNLPAPAVLLSKAGEHDSHGMTATKGDRFLWVLDRHADVADIISVASGERVNTLDLAGELSTNPAPDLVDIAPSGSRIFVALRGPRPLSGDPHNATGSTPGLGIIQVTDGGQNGFLKAIVPLANPSPQGDQQPDPHGVRVRRISQ